jgi:hypothetical protein
MIYLSYTTVLHIDGKCCKVEWDVYHYIKSKSNPSGWMRDALAAAYQQEIIQQNRQE